MKISNQILILLVITLLIFACNNTFKNKYTNSVVSSAHPLASIAGKEIYSQGGNAFDAAVAAAFSLAVVEPSMSGIGGRLQAIYQTHNGKIMGIDASTQIPKLYKSSSKKYSYGYATIGIPGVVAGLIKLHEENGILPLKKVLSPAIKYSSKGFTILPGEALRQQSVYEKLKEFEGTSQYFLKPDKKSFQAGDLFVQKDLSEVLMKIANEGFKGFYEGEIAEKMVSDIQKNGGILTLDDLKNYKALSSRIVKGKFKKHDVYSLYLPSFGAITIQILQILDNLPTSLTEEDWAIKIGKATDLSFQYRKHQTIEDSLKKILSYSQAKIFANKIQNNNILVSNNKFDELPKSWVAQIGHTTHLTAADSEGNIVSLTQTIGPTMGSKVASKGLGFLYNVTLGGYLSTSGEYKPGDRANSHISPTLIFKNNFPVLALGAAGGTRIITAITQVISRFIEQKNTLEKSLMLPRVYPFQDSLWIEDHMGLKDLNAVLDQNKTPHKMIDKYALFGRVHAVALDSINNKWIGSADPDWEGTTETYNNQ